MRVCTLMFFPRDSIFHNYIYCSIYAGWTVRAFHTSPRGSTPPATLLYVFPWCIAALVFAVMHGQSTIMVTWTSRRVVGGGYYKYHSLSVMVSHFGLDKSWCELVWEWSMERPNLTRQNHIVFVFDRISLIVVIFICNTTFDLQALHRGLSSTKPNLLTTRVCAGAYSVQWRCRNCYR